MGALTENWLAGFRTIDDGRTSVANYVWDTGTLAWVVQSSGGAGPSADVNVTNTSLAVTQSGVWSVGRTWNLSSVSDSVNVGNFPVTQPISAAALPLPTGASTETTLAALNAKFSALGQNTMVNSVPVVLASNQSAITVVQATPANLQVSATQVVGSAATRWFTQLSDGTNSPAIKAASTAAVASDPALVIAVSPNNSVAVTQATAANLNATVVQGNAGSVAQSWFARITDATNTAAVKAASTAALAADPALVVTLSPNTRDSVQPATLVVTATAAANTALTLTIPAAGAGLFHYISRIEISRTATAALAGTATLVVTTTNLPGTLAFSFGNAMVAGGTQKDLAENLLHPLKSSVANTATTIVAPAPGAAVLWRMNVFYYTGP